MFVSVEQTGENGNMSMEEDDNNNKNDDPTAYHRSDEQVRYTLPNKGAGHINKVTSDIGRRGLRS